MEAVSLCGSCYSQNRVCGCRPSEARTFEFDWMNLRKPYVERRPNLWNLTKKLVSIYSVLYII
jgi:hypothetical protein